MEPIPSSEMYIILHESSPPIPICRLCGSQRIDLTYIDLSGSFGQTIAFSIQKYLGIEISDTENFSKNVCRNCNGKVEDWNEFYNKCHEIQHLLKSTPTISEENKTYPEASSHPEETILCNDLTKLVEEFVQDNSTGISLTKATLGTQQKSFNTLPDNSDHTEVAEEDDTQLGENCDDHSATEDEFEDEVSSSENDEYSESCDGSRPKLKQRHKKFIFSITFLEKKLERKFSPEEKCKLVKYISKRQNTLICNYFIDTHILIFFNSYSC